MPTSSDKLLRLLLRRGTLSRAELARAMRLSRPAVSVLVENLLRQGILTERGCGASNGGKPPIILELVKSRFGAIGIDIGNETLLRGVLCNAAGEPVSALEFPHDNTFESIAAETGRLARELSERSTAPIAGIGVAVAGQVDYEANEVVYCKNFPLKGENLAPRLEAALGVPVRLDNRARAAARREYYFGAAQNAEDFIFISAERGIGTAIYLGGRLFTGRAGVAGEIRDLLIPAPDGTAMLPVEEAMSEKFLAGLPPEPARSYLLASAAYVITLLSNLLDPALIVLGGRFRDLGNGFAGELAGRIGLEPRHRLEITLSQSGRDGAALGAALDVVLQYQTDTTLNNFQGETK